MKKSVLLLIALLTLALTLTACGAKTLKVTSDMNGQLIQIEKGQKFILSLAGNPTTGYNWEVGDYNANVIEMVGEVDYKSDSKLIGSGGVFTWTFEGVNPGQTTLALVYRRNWEKDVAPLETFSITVEVK